MIDYNETGAILYHAMVQNPPVVLPVDAKATSEPAGTKPTEPRAADPGTTTAQQHPDAPSVLTLPEDAAIGALVSQGTAKPPDQHRIGDNRLYANLGPVATIIGGPSGRTQSTAHTQRWFRDGQFLFTHSPFTKES